MHFERQKTTVQNIKLKIIASTWNDKFELQDGSYSVSDTTDYIEYIEHYPTNPSFHIYINRINNRLVLKIKDGYKLELQITKTMNLFCSTQKLIDKKR